MKLKTNEAIVRLRAEGERHTELAKNLALNLLKNPFAPDVEKKKRLAEDHLIRSESFAAAAALIEGGAK